MIYMVSAFIEISFICLIALSILCLAKPFKSKGVQRSMRLSLAFAFFALIGYSTHLYIPIRSELNPLTVAEKFEDSIRVCIIPETLARTNLRNWVPGTIVNVEVDMLGKYIENYLKERDLA